MWKLYSRFSHGGDVKEVGWTTNNIVGIASIKQDCEGRRH